MSISKAHMPQLVVGVASPPDILLFRLPPQSANGGVMPSTPASQSRPKVELKWRTGYKHPENPDSHYWKVTRS